MWGTNIYVNLIHKRDWLVNKLFICITVKMQRRLCIAFTALNQHAISMSGAFLLTVKFTKTSKSKSRAKIQIKKDQFMSTVRMAASPRMVAPKEDQRHLKKCFVLSTLEKTEETKSNDKISSLHGMLVVC